MDDEVELAEVFGPLSLSTVEKFGGGKIFKVLVVCYDVNDGSGTFEIVSPDLEHFEDGVEFLVVDVVVEFSGVEFS